MLYFVLNKDNTAIKIGYSRNINNRIKHQRSWDALKHKLNKYEYCIIPNIHHLFNLL